MNTQSRNSKHYGCYCGFCGMFSAARPPRSTRKQGEVCPHLLRESSVDVNPNTGILKVLVNLASLQRAYLSNEVGLLMNGFFGRSMQLVWLWQYWDLAFPFSRLPIFSCVATVPIILYSLCYIFFQNRFNLWSCICGAYSQLQKVLFMIYIYSCSSKTLKLKKGCKLLD